MRLATAVAILALLTGPADAWTVYVSNEKANTVSIIDSETWEVVETIPVGQRPRGIAISPDGRELYICASDDDTVEVYDTATMTRTPHPAVGSRPGSFSCSRRRATRSTSPTRTTTSSPWSM